MRSAIGGVPQGPRHRNLRAGVVGQDDADAADHRRGAEAGRAWRRSSTPSTRSTRSMRRSWAWISTTCWCRSRTTANRRSRSSKSWSARTRVDVVVVDSVAALVPRAEIDGEMGEAQMGLQARLMSQALRKLTGAVSKIEDLPDLHQPAAREDRRHVRQPGNDHRRPRAEVLRVGAHRHPAHRRDQGRRAGGRRPHPREGGQEQGRAAVPRGGVRRDVRRRASRRKAICSISPSSARSSRRAAPGSPTAASVSARAARTSSSS